MEHCGECTGLVAGLKCESYLQIYNLVWTTQRFCWNTAEAGVHYTEILSAMWATFKLGSKAFFYAVIVKRKMAIVESAYPDRLGISSVTKKPRMGKRRWLGEPIFRGEL